MFGQLRGLPCARWEGLQGRFQLHTSALRQLLECKPWAEAVAMKALQKAGAYTQALVILYEK